MPPARRTSKKAQTAKATRQPKSKRRQAEVLDAAVNMFYENGYSETSVEDIANELGILKGSLYYYITSKEDLLFEIVREVNDEVSALLADLLEEKSLPPLDRLTKYIIAQVEYNAANIKKISVYHDDLPLLGTQRIKEIRGTLHGIERGVTNLIVEAKENGDIDESIDPALATYAVFATINWLYRWYKPRGRLRPQEIGAFIADFTLHGLTGARAVLAGPNGAGDSTRTQRRADGGRRRKVA